MRLMASLATTADADLTTRTLMKAVFPTSCLRRCTCPGSISNRAFPFVRSAPFRLRALKALLQARATVRSQAHPGSDRQLLAGYRACYRRNARPHRYTLTDLEKAVRLPPAEQPCRGVAKGRSDRANAVHAEARNSLVRAVTFHRLGRQTRAAALDLVTGAITI